MCMLYGTHTGQTPPQLKPDSVGNTAFPSLRDLPRYQHSLPVRPLAQAVIPHHVTRRVLSFLNSSWQWWLLTRGLESLREIFLLICSPRFSQPFVGCYLHKRRVCFFSAHNESVLCVWFHICQNIWHNHAGTTCMIGFGMMTHRSPQ